MHKIIIKKIDLLTSHIIRNYINNDESIQNQVIKFKLSDQEMVNVPDLLQDTEVKYV